VLSDFNLIKLKGEFLTDTSLLGLHKRVSEIKVLVLEREFSASGLKIFL